MSLRNIDPEEIPKDPKGTGNFLTRISKPVEEGQEKDTKKRSRSRSRDRSDGRRDQGDRNGAQFTRFGAAGTGRVTDNEGRKIKGRGRIVSRD